MYFEFEENSGGFLTKIGCKEQRIIDKPAKKIHGGLNGGLNDELQNILSIIKTYPGVNGRQIKNLSNIPQRTLDRRLNELKDRKLIEFIGSKKTGGYYSIL